MTVCLNYDTEMLRSLKALYKYTDRFLTVFSLVGARETTREHELELENFILQRL